MKRPKTAGERQTVVRVMHPKRGEGFAVYQNGPSFFEPIGGEPIPMRIDSGGASSNPSRSWEVAHDPEHGRVELDNLDKSADREKTHERVWHARYGLGWLVSGAWQEPILFEPDDPTRVAPFEFTWLSLSAGRPEYAAKMARTRSSVPPCSPEERNWFTYSAKGGEVFTFRRGGPPGPDVDDTVPKPERKRSAAKRANAKGGDPWSPSAIARRVAEIKAHNAKVGA